MKPKTKEQFLDAIAREITWRKRELSNFNTLACMKIEQRYLNDALYRSGIAILYAHWEGFVKQACTIYLHHVCMQRVKNSELSINLKTLIFHESLKKHEMTKRPSLYKDAIEFLSTKNNHDSKVPYKNIIETKSNLNSQILKEISWLTQMDYSVFETSEQFIDKVLLAKRNHIAHGESCPIDKQTYQDTYKKVLNLIEMVRNQLENNVVLKHYSTSPVPEDS